MNAVTGRDPVSATACPRVLGDPNLRRPRSRHPPRAVSADFAECFVEKMSRMYARFAPFADIDSGGLLAAAP